MNRSWDSTCCALHDHTMVDLFYPSTVLVFISFETASIHLMITTLWCHFGSRWFQLRFISFSRPLVQPPWKLKLSFSFPKSAEHKPAGQITRLPKYCHSCFACAWGCYRAKISFSLKPAMNRRVLFSNQKEPQLQTVYISIRGNSISLYVCGRIK